MKAERIVILGKSAKKNNYCVAGISLETGKWIRPISSNSAIEEAVEPQTLIYSDGSNVQTFDVVEIQFTDKPTQNLIQPENRYYDENAQWKKVGTLSLEKILNRRGFDNRGNIFYNEDRAIEAESVKNQPVRESLLLLPITDLRIKVEIYDDYPKFYAHFKYNGRKYWRFSVGDIAVRDFHRNKAPGEYDFRSKAVAVFSLTNPFSVNGKCYKMLAHVF